jgi:hypothetical protein
MLKFYYKKIRIAMGWTCQHDFQGYCKLVKKPCMPGMKGCTLKSSEYIFTTGNFEEDKKVKEKKSENIDFAALARSN